MVPVRAFGRPTSQETAKYETFVKEKAEASERKGDSKLALTFYALARMCHVGTKDPKVQSPYDGKIATLRKELRRNSHLHAKANAELPETHELQFVF